MSVTPGAPRLLVTGASGFVGSAILRAATARGLSCVGFCRRPPAWPGITTVAGDVGDRAAVEAAMQGVSLVVHAAGLAHKTTGVPLLAWHDVNVTGTRVVVEAAARAGVTSLVHVSSVAVYGTHPGVVDESTCCRPIGPYGESKWRAEQVARSAADAGRLALCIVRPATIAGPGDPGSVARLARLLAQGRLPALGAGAARKCVIGVDDVAEACLRVVTAPVADRETYNLAGPPVSLDEIVDALASALLVAPPRLRVPHGALVAALITCRLVEPHSGGASRLAHALRAWLADHIYDVARFEARYGTVARTDWRKVLQDEARWLQASPLDGYDPRPITEPIARRSSASK